MRILILGGTGLMGHRLVRLLANEAEVFASTQKKLVDDRLTKLVGSKKWITGFDATNLDFCDKIIKDLRPEVIVNCIGITKHQDTSADIGKTILLNAALPNFLSSVLSNTDARLIHLSTDCVFSGQKGNYNESSVPDPTDLYGRSKVLGELINQKDLTLRTSFVGREIQSFTNLFEWARKNRNQKVIGHQRAIYSGLTTTALSKIIKTVIFDFTTLSGLWHVASSPISKLKLIQMLSESLNLNLEIEGDDSFVCDRSLDAEALKIATGIHAPSWHEMLDDYAADENWYQNNFKSKVGD